MAEQKHVSGLTVGPLLDKETHDAILKTRERRKKVAQKAAQKRTSGTSEKSDDTSEKSDTES